MGTISRMIARPEDVEDVAQEAFLRMYVSIGQLQTPEAFDLWMYRLTTHAAYDHLRKRPLRLDVRLADLDDQQVEAATAYRSRQSCREEQERRRIIECVDDLLSQLSPAARILIVMREVEGLTMEEMAAVLGIRVGAAKVRLFRARARLREILSADSAPPRPVRAAAMLAAGQT
jgi:RNA polymerase sigma-70 factor (ECF subfamily)